jgi:hypothetical protein
MMTRGRKVRRDWLMMLSNGNIQYVVLRGEDENCLQNAISSTPSCRLSDGRRERSLVKTLLHKNRGKENTARSDPRTAHGLNTFLGRDSESILQAV